MSLGVCQAPGTALTPAILQLCCVTLHHRENSALLRANHTAQGPARGKDPCSWPGQCLGQSLQQRVQAVQGSGNTRHQQSCTSPALSSKPCSPIAPTAIFHQPRQESGQRSRPGGLRALLPKALWHQRAAQLQASHFCKSLSAAPRFPEDRLGSAPMISINCTFQGG